jgi:hypothetical protein
MNRRPLVRSELDAMSCQIPGCDHTGHGGGLVFHSRCHIDAPTWVTYRDGAVHVTCSECERLIVSITVATAPAADAGVGSVACLVCQEPLTFAVGRGWVHTEGGTYMMRCAACGWRGAPTPSPKACPRCGAVRQLRDDHCANPGRS